MHDRYLEVSNDSVSDLDLSPILKKVTAPEDIGGYGWPQEDALRLLEEYRNFLRRVQDRIKSPDSHALERHSPPSVEVDILWHTHILFTSKYMEDCQRLFSCYLHHEPKVPE
ncbi:glycine-rich domain-containing protein [Flexibacterium corallicola]|uniref:hypothetical protein n=1 Tax=Flexibacterium corallicola TaxID=3037259 RepID=UPI00286EFBE3|nr:hypothetical protein [Pseudovibrio sp. M1P-2-3]